MPQEPASSLMLFDGFTGRTLPSRTARLVHVARHKPTLRNCTYRTLNLYDSVKCDIFLTLDTLKRELSYTVPCSGS